MRAVLVLLLLSCLGCPSTYEPPPVVIPQRGGDLCLQACDVMKHKLRYVGSAKPGCREADDVPDGDGGMLGCTDFCLYQHKNGVFWNTSCIVSQITTCEEIEAVCNPVP